MNAKIEEDNDGQNKKGSLLRRIGKEETLSLAQKIWPDQSKVATQIASEALTVIREKYQTDPTFFSGRSAKGIVGGLFYLLGQRYGNSRTQRQIATSLNTTEVTVRAHSRYWAEPIQNHYRRAKAKQSDAERTVRLSNHP
jgi:transcription initiation factor TFIIIB Brf1 subunit/transcription initiation factor TFIIB